MTTKMAANKTTGILGDDLAVNAEKATSFLASRELPVLWANNVIIAFWEAGNQAPPIS